MKLHARFLLTCFAVCLFASPAFAKKHKHAPSTPAPLATPPPEPAPLPAAPAPKIDPAAPPSASLQPFLETYLSKALTPLGVAAFNQPELVADLKAAYADAGAAASDARRPAFQYAQAVCNLLGNAMSERQAAVNALHGTLATRSSETAQPRGGAYEETTKTRLSDAMFITDQQNAWNTRADTLRKNIIALNLQERAAERRVGVWQPPPPPAPASSPAAAPTPAAGGAVVAVTPPGPVSPPVAAPTPAEDPVIGQWNLKGTTILTLAADHTIQGGRHGSWLYTGTTNAGRNYELHWNPPKNWVDYLVLTSDGKLLDGKTRGNQPIQAYRQ